MNKSLWQQEPQPHRETATSQPYVCWVLGPSSRELGAYDTIGKPGFQECIPEHSRALCEGAGTSAQCRGIGRDIGFHPTGCSAGSGSRHGSAWHPCTSLTSPARSQSPQAWNDTPGEVGGAGARASTGLTGRARVREGAGPWRSLCDGGTRPPHAHPTPARASPGGGVAHLGPGRRVSGYEHFSLTTYKAAQGRGLPRACC